MSGMRRGGRHAPRVVGAARAWETRARNASRRSRDHDVDLCRPCRRARDGALSPSVSDRPMARPNTRSRDAVTRHRDPAKARPTRARTAKHAVDARGVQKSRGFLEDAILLFARVCDGQVRQSLADARASGREAVRAAVFFPWENVTARFFVKVAKQWELISSRQKCEIGLKKTRMYGLKYRHPRRAKSVSVLGEETPRAKAVFNHQSAERRTRRSRRQAGGARLK